MKSELLYSWEKPRPYVSPVWPDADRETGILGPDGRPARRMLDRERGIGPLDAQSFLTGTSQELMYSSIATGTQLNTFTTEDNLQKTLPPVIIPAGFFFNVAATGKSLKVKALGRLGTTGAPTFTWTIRLLTSSTWSAAGIGFSTAALTAGTTVTLAPWELEVDITLRTLAAAGANSTIAAMGMVRGPLSLASPFAGSIPASNTAFTAATFDTSVTAYLFLSAACGTSNAANLIQLEMLKVYGEN